MTLDAAQEKLVGKAQSRIQYKIMLDDASQTYRLVSRSLE
jgi:hypothetical protein